MEPLRGAQRCRRLLEGPGGGARAWPEVRPLQTQRSLRARAFPPTGAHRCLWRQRLPVRVPSERGRQRRASSTPAGGDALRPRTRSRGTFREARRRRGASSGEAGACACAAGGAADPPHPVVVVRGGDGSSGHERLRRRRSGGAQERRRDPGEDRHVAR